MNKNMVYYYRESSVRKVHTGDIARLDRQVQEAVATYLGLSPGSVREDGWCSVGPVVGINIRKASSIDLETLVIVFEDLSMGLRELVRIREGSGEKRT